LSTVTMKELLEAGVHFGHLTRKWNPKMKRYIFGQRNGIHIIDLQHTLREFKKASAFVTEIAAKGGKVLFVGTKRQAQDAIREAAGRIGMPSVTERWLGGTLTNFRTIMTRVQRLKDLSRLDTDAKFQNLTKKERLILSKEKAKLETMLTGITDMNRVPAALFVVDLKRERNCILEAKKLGIPVVAMVDTNCDPDEADYPIPGNDDAVRAIQLFAGKIAEAVEEGRTAYQEHAQSAEADEAMSDKIGRDTGAIRDEDPRKAAAKAPRRREGAPGDKPKPGARKPGVGTGRPPARKPAAKPAAAPKPAAVPAKEE
jgi:small subunit ribosomal protein S2